MTDVAWLWLVGAILLVSLLAAWCWWTAVRLDRMHLRCEAARSALEAQLLRRSSAAAGLATGGLSDPASALLLHDAALAADAGLAERDWAAQSDLTQVLHLVELPADAADPLAADLRVASLRVSMARRIYNGLAATALSLRSRRRVRWFRLAGKAPPPPMIEFDDRPLS